MDLTGLTLNVSDYLVMAAVIAGALASYWLVRRIFSLLGTQDHRSRY
jgi:hypothetical protein